MGKDNQVNEERRAFNLQRVFGSAPWLKTIDKQRHKTKVFRSGNSLAVRIPAGTKLTAGMEMELVVEDGQFLAYEPAEQPKRKFNIAKVAGSATDLKLINDEDRAFVERSLWWNGSDEGREEA
ncbi:MAG: AbrB/MazE/SpoVT family DNA-binding domain-containing protein [Candidatus Andeanibacterium colombiense]|uniref:AbrB/MazE/SpoVT family DNA-binding domain-containing protein n=1 Tax=Candidatus Andeanibacterium colombiense TaxID=3121345 RepID=A0AAJ5X800_9SPHN|nr:MAG: AbrB/MazE/SpoVT family DNA-binding domain-containing protein [Sphingomonadaceae bacterium]